jgi:hypothetical protein
MTPVEIAASLYQRYPQPRTFREDLEAHLIGGYVFSTPDCFLMARPVSSLASDEDVSDPWKAFEPYEQDAWMVWIAAGTMVSVKKHLTEPPYALPLTAWARKNRLRFHRTDQLTRTLCRLFSTSYESSSNHSSAHGLVLSMPGSVTFTS